MKRNASGWWVAERATEARLVIQANAIERARREEAGEAVGDVPTASKSQPTAPAPPKRRSTRRPKTNRVDRPRAGGEWTEAAFWGFLRSGFRQMSRRWPPVVRQALHAARRPYDGPNTRQKWEYGCACCGDWFMGKEVAVDHVEALGPLKSWADVVGFLQRLFVEVDGLRVVCHVCHDRRTQGDRVSKAAARDVGRTLFDAIEEGDDEQEAEGDDASPDVLPWQNGDDDPPDDLPF